MRLISCRNPRPNFGDDLNGVLWPALASELFSDDSAEGFLGIGTIVGMPTPGTDFLHVFSSGVGYDPVDRWGVPRRLWCVRGPLSAQALGAEPRTALTDGAVLTPRLLADEKPVGAGATVVVPHWESLSFSGWAEACALAGFDLVSPVNRDPLAVCLRLRAARLVMTESLHGAIVADALGVPWIALATTGNFSVFKWADWCASVDVPLAPVVAPPPSRDARAAFGRVRWGRSGQRLTLEVEDAWREYRARSERTASAPGPGVRARLKAAAIGSGLLGRSLSPERTAEALRRASRLEPTLSTAARRDRLAAEMMERFTVLRREQAARAPSRQLPAQPAVR